MALWAWFSTRHCISGMEELQQQQKTYFEQEQNEHAGNINDEIQYFNWF